MTREEHDYLVVKDKDIKKDLNLYIKKGFFCTGCRIIESTLNIVIHHPDISVTCSYNIVENLTLPSLVVEARKLSVIKKISNAGKRGKRRRVYYKHLRQGRTVTIKSNGDIIIRRR